MLRKTFWALVLFTIVTVIGVTYYVSPSVTYYVAPGTSKYIAVLETGNDNRETGATSASPSRSGGPTLRPSNNMSARSGEAKVTGQIQRSSNVTKNSKEVEKTLQNSLPSDMTKKVLNSNKKIDDFSDVLKSDSGEYLGLVNSFKDFKETELNQTIRKRMADVFRTGYGRTYIKTEDGFTGWMENGILFRPIRHDMRTMKNFKHAMQSHQSDVEYYVPYDETRFYEGLNVSLDKPVEPKIMLWYYKAAYFQSTPTLEKLWMCPEFPCRITSNQRLYSKSSDAWIMDVKILDDKPPKRRPEQVGIFHSSNPWPEVEPVWANQFNWTFTYRPDSDIQFTFGVLRKRPSPKERDYASLIAKKSKMAVAFISHCKSNGYRDNYIAALRKYMRVDVFGRCGNNTCTHSKHSKCDHMASVKYKFFLSFENTICDDYISEKLFRYLSLDLIVVARGGDGYHRHLPPDIYINTADYKSPRQLAERMIYLDQHPAEYEAILREKNKYVTAFEDWLRMGPKAKVGMEFNFFEAVPLCRICHWIWHLDEHRKSIPDINVWLNQTKCVALPTDFKEK